MLLSVVINAVAAMFRALDLATKDLLPCPRRTWTIGPGVFWSDY